MPGFTYICVKVIAQNDISHFVGLKSISQYHSIWKAIKTKPNTYYCCVCLVSNCDCWSSVLIYANAIYCHHTTQTQQSRHSIPHRSRTVNPFKISIQTKNKTQQIKKNTHFVVMCQLVAGDAVDFLNFHVKFHGRSFEPNSMMFNYYLIAWNGQTVELAENKKKKKTWKSQPFKFKYRKQTKTKGIRDDNTKTKQKRSNGLGSAIGAQHLCPFLV